MCLRIAKSTIQRCQNSRVDVGVANLQRPDLHSLPYKRYKKIKGGHWRYKLTVSLKFATSTIQRYNNSRVDISVKDLQRP